MIVVKTFVSELSKKVEMLHNQIEVFEEKVSQVKSLEEMIKKSTLKEIGEINGDDLSLISEENYKKITEIVNFNDNEDNLNKFISRAVNNKLYAKLLLDGKVDDEISAKRNEAKEWLDKQANYIKEFIIEFKTSNENYLNNLKLSDDLYQKYLTYFENNELTEQLLNITEFNDVLKKSGLIMSEKWQLLKYIAQKNISLGRNNKNTSLMSEIKNLLDEEGKILDGISEEQLDFCISLIDMPENDVKKLNLSNDVLIKYQKIPILYNIKLLYEDTLNLIENNSDDDRKKVETNKKELLEFKTSYDFFKKIN